MEEVVPCVAGQHQNTFCIKSQIENRSIFTSQMTI